MEEFCDTSYSKSAISELCKMLDTEVEKFLNRPLDSSYPFVTIDVTYFKIREDHRIISKTFLTTIDKTAMENMKSLVLALTHGSRPTLVRHAFTASRFAG